MSVLGRKAMKTCFFFQHKKYSTVKDTSKKQRARETQEHKGSKTFTESDCSSRCSTSILQYCFLKITFATQLFKRMMLKN